MIKNVSIWHEDVKVILDFHVFKDLNFDFLIGHPIKAILKGVPKLGNLSINIGKKSLLVPITQSTNFLVEDSLSLSPPRK